MTALRYHLDAAAEVVAAIDYYASRDVDLAVRFGAELHDVEQRIRDAAASYPVFERVGDVVVRRALMADFPFALLFVEQRSATWIVAVMHLRRAPGYWRARV